MPLWIALPLLAVLLFAALFLGPYVMRFINVAIKAVVMA